MLSILILGCFDPFELGLNIAWCNVMRGIMLSGRTNGCVKGWFKCLEKTTEINF